MDCFIFDLFLTKTKLYETTTARPNSRHRRRNNILGGSNRSNLLSLHRSFSKPFFLTKNLKN